MISPRVVLDTNIVLSALLFSATSLSWLRPAWHAGSFRPLVCRETAEELIRVLAYPKFRLSPQDRSELLADYLPWCEPVATPDRLLSLPECRDPLDLAFLRLALGAGAKALVTGDKDLLTLGSVFPVPILTPHIFKSRLECP
jgi:putative PIN family toxin of toxin-antitoxin system